MTGMATLAVMVHYDPDGQVAGHVRYALRRLRPVADRLVFVTTAQLSAGAAASLEIADTVISRPNVGYDFYSWRAGLLSGPDWTGYERVILANDSIVGPLVGVEDLLEHMRGTGADVYGITTSAQVVRHVQSYWTCYGPAAIAEESLRRFWAEMVAVDERQAVIERYELGLGRLVEAAGLRVGSYFTATPHEERIMAARMASYSRPPTTRALAAGAAYALQPVRRVVESPVLGLWDRALDGARLPAVKVSLFSRNPYRIDRAAALAELTEQFPEAFDGFEAYLRRLGVAW